jgi:hypothetical protein
VVSNKTNSKPARGDLEKKVLIYRDEFENFLLAGLERYPIYNNEACTTVWRHAAGALLRYVAIGLKVERN